MDLFFENTRYDFWHFIGRGDYSGIFSSLIYTNIEDVGQAFVVFRVVKGYNGISRSFLTIFDWLFGFLPLALYVFFLTR